MKEGLCEGRGNGKRQLFRAGMQETNCMQILIASSFSQHLFMDIGKQSVKRTMIQSFYGYQIFTDEICNAPYWLML